MHPKLLRFRSYPHAARTRTSIRRIRGRNRRVALRRSCDDADEALVMDLILPVLDYRDRRRRYGPCRGHDESLPVRRNIELKVPGGPELRDARDAEQRLRLAKFERPFNLHGMQRVVQADEKKLAAVRPPAHQPGAVS